MAFVALSIAALFIGWISVAGWNGWSLDLFQYPFIYSNDGLSQLAIFQRIHESISQVENSRIAYPFTATFYDYPDSDFGNYLLAKILSAFTGSAAKSFNAYFLAGYILSSIFTFTFLRLLKIQSLFCMVGALIFSCLPYHLERLRLGHIFFASYFVVPVFFYYAYRIYDSGQGGPEFRPEKAGILIPVINLFVSASFGVYFAFFGVVLVLVAGVAGYIKHQSKRILLMAVGASAIISLGVMANVAQSMYHKRVHGPNAEVASRNPAESEIYGLKIAQLLMPIKDHRNAQMSKLATNYAQTFPYVNENSASALGLVGAFGFISLLLLGVSGIVGRPLSSQFAFLSSVVLLLVLISSVGGFSTFFALWVSPLIRGWNRISIFIGLASVAAAMIILDNCVKALRWPANIARILIPLMAGIICLLAILDQTPPACDTCKTAIRKAFDSDREFVGDIEQSLPQGAAVFQLPYLPFPEVPPLFSLPEYALLTGFLHSNTLRWSHGGMKGRIEDLFYRKLSNEPLPTQIQIIRKLGFSGIYIDRRGFENSGKQIEAELATFLGEAPAFISRDSTKVFYRLPNAIPAFSQRLSAEEIMEKAAFFPNAWGGRYAGTLEKGIDFRRNDLPNFVKDVVGLAPAEPWGRWSDANIYSHVIIRFMKPLPSSFTLHLRAQAYGANTQYPITVRIADKQYHVRIAEMSDKRIRIRILAGVTDKIEIIPPMPISPTSMGLSSDARRLGIGLQHLAIVAD